MKGLGTLQTDTQVGHLAQDIITSETTPNFIFEHVEVLRHYAVYITRI